MSYLEDSRENSDPAHDPVRPGEQWFFYWKTSAALWESRILQFPKSDIIFIPLYWGFHAESAAEWDFGKIHSERDLLRLSQLMTQHGRRFCWILPLSPAPFFPNGGVPAFAARTMSLSQDGIHLAALDREHNLNKLLTFFEPKVFSAFSQFLKSFVSFLSEQKVEAPVWGAEFFYLEENRKVSYFTDASVAFEHGFSRYFRQKFPEGTGAPADPGPLKHEFTREVAGLFRETAEAFLSTYWMGRQEVIVLGGSPRDCIQRALPAGKSQLSYARELVKLHTHDEWLSSALLSRGEKRDLLPVILSEHFGPREAEEKYLFQKPRTELTEEYSPYGVVEVYTDNDSFRKQGLLGFLDDHYKSLYTQKPDFSFSNEWVLGSQHKIKVFQGSKQTRVHLGQILKLFLMGHRVLLDLQDLPAELEKKLHIFFIENNIRSQTVNFVTPTSIYELGDGRLVTFEGRRLVGKPEQRSFWQHIFKYFTLTQPEVSMDEDVLSFWKIRGASAHELSYLDVRRVNFYNPTSYKKHVTIHTKNHFAFLRAVDPLRATAKSVSQGVEIELLPNGKITLDFGHYEEVAR